MSTMNISLPDALREFVEQHVVRAGYGTSSEYVRELIRRDQDRLHLRSRMLDGVASPLSGVTDETYFEALRVRAAGTKAKRRRG